MDVRGSERRSEAVVAPGALVDGRFRVAGAMDRRSSGAVTCAALDERTRQRVRLRLCATRPEPRVLGLRHPALAEVVAAGVDPWRPRPAASDASFEGRVPQAGPEWAWVASTWFDGEPLQIPEAPLADGWAVHAWAESLAEVLDALELLHRALGHAHGALGLRSFWVAADGRLRLVDAATPDPELLAEDLAWAPPERSFGPTTDPRSDLYAVAAVFYALAAGRAPFGLEPAEARAGHAQGRLPDDPSLPVEVLAVLRTAMEKRPHHRFASAAKMKAVLRRAIDVWEDQTASPWIDPRPVTDSVDPIAAYDPIPEPEVFDPGLFGDAARDVGTDGTLAPPPARRFLPSAPSSPVGMALAVGAFGVGLSVAAWVALAALLSILLGA